MGGVSCAMRTATHEAPVAVFGLSPLSGYRSQLCERRMGGVTGRLTRNVSVYGEASYLTSVSGASHTALKGVVGLRVMW